MDRLMQYVYDSGPLIAIDTQRDNAQVSNHRRRLARRHRIIVPAPVAAQVVRRPTRQAQLMLALRSCDVIPFRDSHVNPVGELLARSATSDVVDALVALTAALEKAAVITADTDDIAHLLDMMGVRLPVLKP